MDSTKSKSKPCKACGKDMQPDAENTYFPFCSERCKWLDLGKWFSEDFVVPGHTPADFETDR
jgi:endogenous inhibitor of DNA gyrase (YacG/DUF329 family)